MSGPRSPPVFLRRSIFSNSLQCIPLKKFQPDSTIRLHRYHHHPPFSSPKTMTFFKPLLLALLGVAHTLAPVVAAQNNLFHGTSVVLYPNETSTYPGDSTFVAANFYC